jgi:hypothetical protein
MSRYVPGAASTSTPSQQGTDTQSLIGLLGSLMPLLMQIEIQARGPMFPFGSFQQGMLQTGSSQPGYAQSNPGPLSFDHDALAREPGQLATMNPQIDHQAAVDLVENITAGALRTLSNYLETHAGQQPGLEICIPIVTQAARCFTARNYGQTLAHIWQAYRIITALRATNPQLPPPRPFPQAGTSLPSDATVIH